MSAPVRTRWPEIALFSLVFGVFAFFYQAGGWNQNTRIDLVRAIVERGSVRIDPFEKNTGDKAKRGDHYYADKAPGISLLSVPVYALVHSAFGEQREMDRFQGIASYLCTLWAVSLPSALAVVALYRAGQALGLGPGVSAGLAVSYAFGTIALPYSTLLYGHQSAAAFSFIAFGLLLSVRQGLSEPSPRRFFLAGTCLGMAVLIEYTALVSFAIIACYAFVTIRPTRQLGWLVAGVVVPVAILLVYHAVAFGGPLTLPYAFSTQEPRHRGFFMGLGLPSLRALYYLTVDEYRGLFYGSPWLLLALPGVGLMIRNRALRAEAVVCGALASSYLWMNASLTDWHGGAGIGPRHLVAILPFLTLCVGAVLSSAQPRAVRVLGGSAAAMGISLSSVLMFVGTAVKPEVPRAVERPFHDFLFPNFLTDQIAINTQSIDMSTGKGRTVRQAWNLGEMAGLSGRASLLPLALWVLVVGTWLVLILRLRSPD